MIFRSAVMVSALFLAWGFGQLQAAEPAPMRNGSGTVTYVATATETTNLKNGGSVIRTRMKGIIVADDPKTPFHLAGQSCGGTTVLSANGAPPHSSGYCSTIDKDGDAWWIWWRAEGKGSVWEFIDGTGKYENIEGKGKTTTLVRLPDGRQTLRWEGSWRMR